MKWSIFVANCKLSTSKLLFNNFRFRCLISLEFDRNLHGFLSFARGEIQRIAVFCRLFVIAANEFSRMQNYAAKKTKRNVLMFSRNAFKESRYINKILFDLELVEEDELNVHNDLSFQCNCSPSGCHYFDVCLFVCCYYFCFFLVSW